MSVAFPNERAATSGERRRAIAILLAALAVTALVAWSLATPWTGPPLPFLSEDWTHLEEMRGVASFASALDLAREPLRPLQHAFFWLLAHSGMDPAGEALPVLAHTVGFALHAASILLVAWLARSLGLPVVASAVAALLFALFPNAKSLAWSAAIGSPGRVAFELLASTVFVRRLEGRATSGALGLAAFVVALGWHESAILLPLLVLVWAACRPIEVGASLFERVRRALRDPWLVAACALTLVEVLHLAFLRPQRHHAPKELAALPANAVKAALSVVPEPVRVVAIEGLRGHLGAFGWGVAALALLFVATLLVLALRRGGIARFAALVIVIDLALPVVGAGFVQRYAYFSSALLALAVAAAFLPRRNGMGVVLAVAVVWTIDSCIHVVDLRLAADEAVSVARSAVEQRARYGDREIVLLDLPDAGGLERDIPLFNWGTERMLDAFGARGPWILWRTKSFRTGTDFELVDAERVENAVRSGIVLRPASPPLAADLVRVEPGMAPHGGFR